MGGRSTKSAQGRASVKSGVKITVYRGTGNNISKGDNEGFNWVALDKSIAANYAGLTNEGKLNIKEFTITKPKNIFEFPYRFNTDVRASGINDHLRNELGKQFKAGKMSETRLRRVFKLLDEYESAAGNNLEKYHTKVNKKGASKKIAKILKELGFDAIRIRETNRDGKLIDTYGIIK